MIASPLDGYEPQIDADMTQIGSVILRDEASARSDIITPRRI